MMILPGTNRHSQLVSEGMPSGSSEEAQSGIYYTRNCINVVRVSLRQTPRYGIDEALASFLPSSVY